MRLGPGLGHRGYWGNWGHWGNDGRGLGPGTGGSGSGLLGSGCLRGLGGSWSEHWGLLLWLRGRGWSWGLGPWLGARLGPRTGPRAAEAWQRWQTELGQLRHPELERSEAGELGHSHTLLAVSCLGLVDRPPAHLSRLPLKLPELQLRQSSLLGLGISLGGSPSLNRPGSGLSQGARLLLQDGVLIVMRLVKLRGRGGLPEPPADPEGV